MKWLWEIAEACKLLRSKFHAERETKSEKMMQIKAGKVMRDKTDKDDC
jgi:hypothetical protein